MNDAKATPPSPQSPAVTGPAQVGQAPLAPGSSPPPQGRGLPLPHERDESTGVTDEEPNERIQQAARDIQRGLVDTDMHATPGLDAKKRRELVPGPGGAPPGSVGGT